jgi:hypothetical protein
LSEQLQLVNYDAARSALQKAHRVDEVKLRVRRAAMKPAKLRHSMPAARATTSRTHSPRRLSDQDLIAHLRRDTFGPIKGLYKRLKAQLPYIREARKRWGKKFQGRRVPVPGKSSWTEFCEQELGVSVRTIQKWLAEDDEEKAAAKKHLRDKYDSSDIAHLEKVARVAQKVADNNPDDPAFDPIRKAIKEKPSGFFVREGRVDVQYYEGNKADGNHYILTPKAMREETDATCPLLTTHYPKR